MTDIHTGASMPRPQVSFPPPLRRQKNEAWPRGLRRADASHYVGVSPSQFDKWVEVGTMPKPTKKGGIVLWDRFALDMALEAIFYPTEDHSQWDSVRV